MPCANPVQKFNRAKLILLDGVTVQESARSLAVLTLIEVGSLVGAAAWVGEPKARAAQTISTNRIEGLRCDHNTAAPRRRADADIALAQHEPEGACFAAPLTRLCEGPNQPLVSEPPPSI